MQTYKFYDMDKPLGMCDNVTASSPRMAAIKYVYANTDMAGSPTNKDNVYLYGENVNVLVSDEFENEFQFTMCVDFELNLEEILEYIGIDPNHPHYDKLSDIECDIIDSFASEGYIRDLFVGFYKAEAHKEKKPSKVVCDYCLNNIEKDESYGKNVWLCEHVICSCTLHTECKMAYDYMISLNPDAYIYDYYPPDFYEFDLNLDEITDALKKFPLVWQRINLRKSFKISGGGDL